MVSRVCRIVWRRKEQLLWTGKRQFFSLSSSKRKTDESALTIDPPITLLILVYARIFEKNDAFGQNNWPSCSHFDKTVLHLIIGNVLGSVAAIRSFYTMIAKRSWYSLVFGRNVCVLEKSITSDDKSKVFALLKTKRTVYSEYPSGEMEVVRAPLTDVLAEQVQFYDQWSLKNEVSRRTSSSHLCSPTMENDEYESWLLKRAVQLWQ